MTTPLAHVPMQIAISSPSLFSAMRVPYAAATGAPPFVARVDRLSEHNARAGSDDAGRRGDLGRQVRHAQVGEIRAARRRD